MEVVAPRGGDGETDAGARRIGLRFGADLADQHTGCTAGIVQRLTDRGVVRPAFLRRLQRDDRLCRTVERLQRLSNQQQRWHFGGAGGGGGE